MQLDGFIETWKEIKQLDEQAHFDRTDIDSDAYKEFKNHYEKHGRALGLTEDEYDEAADALSKLPANPISGLTDIYNVQGYITNSGKKVKFIPLKNRQIALVVYVRDDVTGTAVSYYHPTFEYILRKANPYNPYKGPKSQDFRYKSDLDGGLKGLEYFK